MTDTTTNETVPERQQWDYTSIRPMDRGGAVQTWAAPFHRFPGEEISGDRALDALRSAGALGWDLVAVTGEDGSEVLWLKRPAPAPRPNGAAFV